MTISDPFKEVFATASDGTRLEHLRGREWLIVDPKTGQCQRVRIEQTKRDVRDAVAKFGEDRTVACYRRLTDGVWRPLYKPAP